MAHHPKIELYTTMLCPYCHMAKRVLKAKNQNFTEYDVNTEPHLRAEMKQRAGGRHTVPQIFINGKHIGGCDDLMALDSQGRLDPLLTGS